MASAEDHVHSPAEVRTDAELPAPEVLVGRDEDPILLCTPVGDLRVARLVPKPLDPRMRLAELGDSLDLLHGVLEARKQLPQPMTEVLVQ